ncbi:Flagellar motility protein MotE, a chaperone for MotC folding [Tistlia consotensis]|uniref:Flagellar motility protein MotE, a chaperone for MotC folding n=1 Tax=Tistlia consotensis USBA 355 TaxID=560819 RepID=A0A1Y6CPT3_9PROT|nr:hypothetical protein [Tistlia consotensis]SMF68004.1 Flagellar motility protein MotE, a chaperone for MotC folding [Tistlia consotensis USBA 355]SNR99184.1 Flagellar motility protein MotE, a chaperone for MotC folding [Tistlia consotensis]
MTFRLLPFVIAVAGVALALRIGGMLHDMEALAANGKATPSAPVTSYAEPGPQTAEKTGAKPATPGADLPSDPLDMSDQDIELLQALAKRRQQIDERAAEIDQRASLLSAAEKRIDEKIGHMEDLKKQIDGLLVKYDDQEEKQMKSLVKIYENMKPKDAARIFEKLDMDVLLSVIERMKERKSAPVLAQMNPDRAQEITLELATRRQLPLPRN